MKRYLLPSILAFSLLPVTIKAQVNNSEFVTVPAGTYMNIQGSFGLLNNSTGNIVNNGTIIITGNYKNDGNFNSGALSLVRLEGPYQRIEGNNSTTFNDIEIAGTGNKKCFTDEYIAKTLKFDPLSNSAKIIIEDNNLTLLTPATITNPSNKRFVVTNGTGSLIKKSVPNNNTDFLFPVGSDTLSFNNYKPVTLNYSGVKDTFAVRVQPGIVPTAGPDNSSCVQYTYHVEEGTAGGTDASLKLGWNSPTPQQDEGSTFDRSMTYMWQYKNSNSAWNVILPADSGAIANAPLDSTDWAYKVDGITDFSAASQWFILRNYQILSFINPIDTAQSTCKNSTTTISVDVAGTDVHYQWQENCGSGWSNITDDNILYSGSQTDNLTLISPGIGMNGCMYQCIALNQYDTIVSDQTTLTVNELPVAFAGNDTTFLVGNSVQLLATGGISYQWTPDTFLDYTDIQNPISTPLNDITYIVNVTDANGCTDADTINLTVDLTTSVYIPSAFSPNNDGHNDVLYVRGKGIKDIVFIIYDRWGEKIFETNDIKNGWDGTFDGKKLATAVFVYYAKGTYYGDKTFELNGNVTLIR